jgi:hypothetical protein
MEFKLRKGLVNHKSSIMVDECDDYKRKVMKAFK